MEEIWKDIPGYEGYYQVSNLGRVKSLERKVKGNWGNLVTRPSKILKPVDHGHEYLLVHLSKENHVKQKQVHRLVAEAFIPNTKKKPVVNHLDENKTNNVLSNLEWATFSENENHGTKKERSSKTRIRKGSAGKPVNQLDENGNIIATFKSKSEAARKFGVTSTAIQRATKSNNYTSAGYKWSKVNANFT